MQMWNTNLPSNAIAAHKNMSNLTAEKPSIDVMQFIRNPDGSQNEVGAPLMPLSLGDAAQSFLTLSEQQYFFLDKWNSGLYNKNWTNPAVGPFRINAEVFDYSRAQKDQPFLGVGYTPLRPFLVEPGDLCKFMAVPWHTDYNSCATHTPAPKILKQ